MGDRQWFILYVLVCLEIGIFLVLVPWSAIWERNYFLSAYPSLRPIVLAPTFRGAVAGLGVANIYVGLREIVNRRYRRGPAPEVSREGEPERESRPGRLASEERRDRAQALAASEESR